MEGSAPRQHGNLAVQLDGKYPGTNQVHHVECCIKIKGTKTFGEIDMEWKNGYLVFKIENFKVH